MLFKPCDFYHFVRLFSIKIINNNNNKCTTDKMDATKVKILFKLTPINLAV